MGLSRFIRGCIMVFCLSMIVTNAAAQQESKEYVPMERQAGKDVVWLPTAQALVETYGVKTDAATGKEVRERYAALVEQEAGNRVAPPRYGPAAGALLEAYAAAGLRPPLSGLPQSEK